MRRFPAFGLVALALSAALGAGSPAQAAAPDPALLALPANMATALIANDASALRAACAPSGTIVDEFSPYSWSGADVCVRWSNAFAAFAKQAKMSNFKATILPKPFTDVTGNRAYLVAQVKFDGIAAGKPFSELGTWTFVVTKNGGAWKIGSIAWGAIHH